MSRLLLAACALFALLLFAQPVSAADGTEVVGIGIGVIVLICVGVFLFEMIPAIIAAFRGHPNQVPIAIICFFFSWTVIGWIACLAWAFSSTESQQVVVNVNRRRRRRDDDYDD